MNFHQILLLLSLILFTYERRFLTEIVNIDEKAVPTTETNNDYCEPKDENSYKEGLICRKDENGYHCQELLVLASNDNTDLSPGEAVTEAPTNI